MARQTQQEEGLSQQPGSTYSPAVSSHGNRLAAEGNLTKSGKALSGVQIALALIAGVLVFATPFAYYSETTPYRDASLGYEYDVSETVGIWFKWDTSTWLLTLFVVIVSLVVAFAGYMWGWRSPRQTAAKYAKLTFGLGLLELVVGIVGAIHVSAIAMKPVAIAGFPATTWWLSVATYGELVSAAAFIVIGLVEIRLTRSPSPERRSTPPTQAPVATAAPSSPVTVTQTVPASSREPRFSADRKWWWTGAEWVPAINAPRP